MTAMFSPELRGLLDVEGPAKFKALFAVDSSSPVEVDYVNAHLEQVRADYPEHAELVRRSLLLGLPQEWSKDLLNGLPERLLHTFAADCAEFALRREQMVGREPDPRSWAVVDAKRAWLRGELGDRELIDAWDAAWAVAKSQSMKHRWGTDWGAVAYAAWSAAKCGCRSYAYETALDAAEYAAGHVNVSLVRDWQIQRLAELCCLFAIGELT